jgi:hypothetical protein
MERSLSNQMEMFEDNSDDFSPIEVPDLSVPPVDKEILAKGKKAIDELPRDFTIGALTSIPMGAADIVDMGKAITPSYTDRPEDRIGATPSLLTIGTIFDILSEAGINRENAEKVLEEVTGIELKGNLGEFTGEFVGIPASGTALLAKGADFIVSSIAKHGDKLDDVVAEAKSLFRKASGGDDFDGMAPAVAGDVKAQTDQLIAKPDLPDTSISPNMIGLNTPQGRAAVKEYTVAQSKFPDISNEELFQRTGVYKGRDGKFRYELDTTNAKLIGRNFKRVDDSSGSWDSLGGSYIRLDNKDATLGDILNFDSLYKEYSKDLSIPVKGRDQEFKIFKPIKDIKIVRLEDAPFPTKDTTQAAYSAADDTIYIGDTSNYEELLSSILHEVQHAIQRREGFITGSDSSRFLPKDFDEKYTEVKKAFGVLQKKARRQPNNTTLKNALGTVRRRMTRMKTKLQEANINYMKKYGEIEARNVQRRKEMRLVLQRQGLSDEEVQKVMRTVPPEETQRFKGKPIKTGDTFDERDEIRNVFRAFDPDNQPVEKNEGGLMLQKGGAIPMDRQMSMFDEGGLEDDGGTVDPVSGNDVPPGSSKEEVRDDIPAQLSEGEFVFPADVVRYIGLEKLMMLRQQAKMGLKMMDEMGQMGNSEEATIPDDLPFGMMDLIIVDNEDEKEDNNKKEMQEGGVVTPQDTGVFYQPSQFAGEGNRPGIAQPAPDAASRQFVQQPQQSATPTVRYEQPQATFGDFLKPQQGGPQTITIVNKETGEKELITFIPGVTKIKEGFVREEDYVPKEIVPETETTRVETATVAPETGGDDEARQRREEEMYGPGGGRLGIAGEIYGVSFDMPEGFVPGITTAFGTSLGLATGKPLPPDVMVKFKQGNIEFNVSGSDYNELKEIIKTQPDGANSKAAENKLNELKNKDDRLNLEKAVDAGVFGEGVTADDIENSRKEGSDALVKRLMEQGATAEEARRRNKERLADVIAKQKEVTAAAEKRKAAAAREAARERARFNERQAQLAASPEKDDRPERTPQEARASAQRAADRLGTSLATRGRAKGGLMETPKPKSKKKMKRGGLASKK